MLKRNNRTVIAFSKFFSNFFNPMTSLVLYLAYFSSVRMSAQEALQKFLPIILIMILPITVWIFWNVKRGNYSNMDVSNRNQRKSLYSFIAAAIAVYLVYEYFRFDRIDLVVSFLMVLLLLMQLSNYFIKSSMHTAFNVYVAALFFALNIKLGILWFGIAILVGYTRIILKRHTVKEVISGAIIALSVSFIYLYANIMISN
ncbi:MULTISPECIES: phosphatase PAP2 family protein [Chryseobacterium]|uniref:phosphatase PAP2 family protein n=1 Tax=Chryseobacterium sp. R2A-55 TaxID=2744445 RepID=UPI001F167B6D|nr:phosphatase PAP2 family protein [Chryseobacterium sp. R2A-55]